MFTHKCISSIASAKVIPSVSRGCGDPANTRFTYQHNLARGFLGTNHSSCNVDFNLSAFENCDQLKKCYR